MGQVFLARDLTDPERVVALKLLLPEFLDATADFMREYVLQRRLCHPSIPRVHDFGFGTHAMGEVPYFVMDYVRGTSLARAMQDLDRLERAWPWILETLRALDHLHGLGYLHRDLKPSNILVDERGHSEPAAQLIDYGIAIPMEAEPEELFIGTPEYSAPELMAGDPFDVRQDLYAVGLLLYEIVTGHRPWPQEDPTSLWEVRTYGRPPAIQRRDCPPALIALIGDLLAPNPDDRPSSAAEVIERFCAAVGLEPTIERPEAFRLRLETFPLATSVAFERAAREWHAGLRADLGDDGRRPAILALESPPGLDGPKLLAELADRGAVGGARLVRIRLDAPATEPLSALSQALDVFRRLREQRSRGRVVDLPGPAGAATMLTRLHDATVLSIEGLQRADAASLEVLGTVFADAANPRLRVIATFDPAEAATAPRAFAALLRAPCTFRVEAAPLTRESAAAWLDDVLGPGLVSPERVDTLVRLAEGRHEALRRILADEFAQGRIVRVADGYRLRPGFAQLAAPRRAEAPVALEDLLACVIHPFPEEVLARYLGERPGRLTELVREGHLVAQPHGHLAPAGSAALRERYRALAREQRHQLHRRLAQAIAASPRYPGQAVGCAREWLRTDTPLLAAPWLVVAANEAADRHDPASAEEHFGRAANLLEAHAHGVDDPRVVELRVQLARTGLRLGRLAGAFERWRRAARELFELGTAHGQLAAMREGLDALLDASAEAREWEALTHHAAARGQLALDPDDGEAQAAWALATIAWAEGRPDEASQGLEQALERRLSAPVELKLVALLAEIHVYTQRVTAADGALERYRLLAERAGHAGDRALCRVLAAEHARLRFDPARALALLRESTTLLGDSPARRVSARLELGLALAHHDLDGFVAALDHADRARALAERDGDPETALAARVAEALAVAACGQVGEARELLAEVEEDLHPTASALLRAAWRHATLATRLADPEGPSASSLVGAARRFAVEATKQRLRGWAVRGWALAARAALAAGEAESAVDFADGALDLAERWGDVGVAPHDLLLLLARAQWRAGERDLARGSLAVARERLGELAARIDDLQLRQTWLDLAAHRHLRIGDLEAPGPASRPVVGVRRVASPRPAVGRDAER